MSTPEIFDPTSSNKKEKDEVILQRINTRINNWFDYFRENNRTYHQDNRFLYLDDGQWTDEEITEYDQENKPRETFNLLSRLVQALEGEYSDNVPSLKVRAVDTVQINQQKIDILEGILRNIAFMNDTRFVYQNSLICALSGGYGAYRITVEPEDTFSFNQKICYHAVEDPTTCFWDPAARKPSKWDGGYCGICHIMRKDEFKAKYPDIKMPQSFTTNETFGQAFRWLTENDIVVAEYYEKRYFKRHVALLSNGQVLDYKEAEELVANLEKKRKKLLGLQRFSRIPKIEIYKDEEHDDFEINFYKVIKDQIIDSSKWDIKRLPIVFQNGVSRWVNGKQHTISFIHTSLDAQRSYNYSRSDLDYRLKLSRYEQWIAPIDSVDGYEKIWRDVRSARGALLYKLLPGGEKPERFPASQIPQEIPMIANLALAEMQNIPGRFEANLGAIGNESSGVAIANRQRPGNLSAKPYFENARLAIEEGAKITLDLIQKVFDTQRIVSVTQENGKEENIKINDETSESSDITQGKFNVFVTVGSSFEIQRAEAVEQLFRTIQAIPNIANYVADIVVENLDLKNTPQIVKRIRENLIPEIAVKESDDPIAKQNALQKQKNQEMQEQVQMQIIANKATNDHIKAMSTQINAMANMMNAQTQRMEALAKGILESKKIEAEESKAELETVQEVLKTEKASEKMPQNQRNFMDDMV